MEKVPEGGELLIRFDDEELVKQFSAFKQTGEEQILKSKGVLESIFPEMLTGGGYKPCH